jgi:TonB family protein
VTVLRSGIPDTLPGRSINLCERGLAAVLAGELVPGEAVGIEVRLPLAQDALRTRATVRHQDKLRCGLEFVGMSAEQHATIREWVKDAKAEAVGELAVQPTPMTNRIAEPLGIEKEKRSVGDIRPEEKRPDEKRNLGGSDGRGGGGSGRLRRKKRRWIGWAVVLIVASFAAGVFWWKWTRGWEELEAGLNTEAKASAEKPQAQVPAEVMQKLLVHRVEPVYPLAARQARLEGIIALDIIVGRDGSVVSMKALNGPEVLARAAMDALRWWKFEPYRVNGEPASVETTVAVEFKR